MIEEGAAETRNSRPKIRRVLAPLIDPVRAFLGAQVLPRAEERGLRLPAAIVRAVADPLAHADRSVLKVHDVMVAPARSCGLQDALHDVARTFWELDLGWLVVVDEAGRPIGAITDRDVCMAAYTSGRPLAELQVRGAMATAIEVIGLEDPITLAAERMRKHQLRRLPVVDGLGRLAGVLTLGDLARASSRVSDLKGAEPIEITRTLAAISEPRAPDLHGARPLPRA